MQLVDFEEESQVFYRSEINTVRNTLNRGNSIRYQYVYIGRTSRGEKEQGKIENSKIIFFVFYSKAVIVKTERDKYYESADQLFIFLTQTLLLDFYSIELRAGPHKTPIRPMGIKK